MYSLKITENGKLIESKKFDFKQNKEMFDFAFSKKTRKNKIFLNGNEILDDWDKTKKKIQSFDYRNYVLTRGILNNATQLIEKETLFLYKDEDLFRLVSYAEEIIELVEELKENVKLLEDAVEETTIF